MSQPYTPAEALAAIDRMHNRAWCVYCGGGPATNECAMLLRDYVAQAQADAPPPPDVIRRGHRALDDLERVVHAFPDDGRRSRIRSRVAEARAAMHQLPKEG